MNSSKYLLVMLGSIILGAIIASAIALITKDSELGLNIYWTLFFIPSFAVVGFDIYKLIREAVEDRRTSKAKG
ncbi:hypothetical protein ABGV42_01385 [Paenibacillus pabuli]|uniref:hypothetical protein n=1 Tax=Paenibacillus pabuli TaxID=1472 RepID=UPI00324222C6